MASRPDSRYVGGMLLPPADILLIFTGAFAGGFVSGLTGFGTGLTALPLWLGAVPTVIAAQLVVALSVYAQAQTLPAIRHAIDLKRIWHYLAAGLAGAPVGLALLPHIDVALFKLGVGAILVLYCSFVLFGERRLAVQRGGRAAEALVGLAGGVLGGIAGLSGVVPTIWAGLRQMPKDERRALFQAFNLTILSFTLALAAVKGLLTSAFWGALLIALPGTIVGATLGQAIYRRLDDRRFDRIVLSLLLASGLMLIYGNGWALIATLS